MAHDVFISYSTKDADIADAVCRSLETNGVKCWIAPRDITPGENYSGCIVDAISAAKVFLLILSSHSNASQHVLSEVQTAFNSSANLITYKIDNVLLRKELQYYLSTKQWLELLNKEFRDQLRDLVTVVRTFLKKSKTAKIVIPDDIGYEIKLTTGAKPDAAPQTVASQTHPVTPPKPRKFPKWAMIAAAAVVVAAAGGLFAASQFTGKKAPAIGNSARTAPASGSMQPTGTVWADAAFPTDVTVPTEDGSAANSGDAMLFKPVGEAKIKTTDGQTYTCPANCILFKDYYNLMACLPKTTSQDNTEVTNFEDIKSISVEASAKDSAASGFSLKITKLNGVQLTYAYASGDGTFVFANEKGRIDLNLGSISTIDFDFSKVNSIKLKLALVTPVTGNTFYIPADLFMVKILSLDMGVSTGWADGLPMDGGNTVAFTKMKSLDILKSEETGFNGWDDVASVDVGMNEGDHIQGKVTVDSLFFVGVNRLGLFNLDITGGLKSIVFNPEAPAATVAPTATAQAETPTASGSALAFKPAGEAQIKTTDGQTYTCPANCVLYEGYYGLMVGFPEKTGSNDNTVAFEDIKSFTVETKTEQDGYTTDYILKIAKKDGGTVTYTYAYSARSLLFINGSGRKELDLGSIAEVDFDFTRANSANIKLALITPDSGNAFYTPADLLTVEVNSVGMGVSSSLGTGLPLAGGNDVPFAKMRAFSVLDSKETGINGWGDEASVDIELTEGDHIQGDIKEDAVFFMGVNRLGAFSLDISGGLKSIAFPKSR